MKRGFTLIELLVVITILAILAGAALPYVQAYVAESRLAKAKSDLEEIARALAVYETREGEYSKSDVSDLTGRYLNKSPIDPWGVSYVVATQAGTVYSKGPDRKSTSTAEKLDDIIFPYQPPLALVSVKWVDRNQSGAVDTQNTPDQLQLTFSRKLANPVASLDDIGEVDALLSATTGGSIAFLSSLIVPTSVQIVASKTLVYDVATTNAFTAGQDSVNVKSGNTLQDNAVPTANKCISDQPVLILPQ
ncbi:MAG: prepilin-type N-terminal cleavage/methylation domain-containing protein [Candidatus Riflebacteria bacterium]|nr:prepilin-type N-terminal cleavage/methylation domain-containing protein [Candidatus Riflebacteria bacterium]